MLDKNNVLRSSEIIARLFEIISNLPEANRRKLMEVLAKREQSKFTVKRRNPRKTSKIAVDFSIDDLPFTHFIQNVSKSGAFIETELPFLTNKELSMTFILPGDKDPIKTTGKIVRTDSKGIGVQFDKPILEI